MLIQRASDIASSEITSETLYHNRREFIKTASSILGLTAVGGASILEGAVAPLAKGKYDTTEKPTPYEDVTTYNNYYEFGTGKDDPARNSKNFKPKPWTVKVDGMVKKPATYDLDELIKG